MSEIVLTDSAGVPKSAPRVSHNAQMHTKIYFWHNPRTDHILQGAPPQFTFMMPPGYQCIECNHAHEAESWSARLNEQDKRIAEMTDYEREMIEGPMRADLRRELKTKIHQARNGINRMMLERALKELDKAEANGKTVRESYLHVEGFENGR